MKKLLFIFVLFLLFTGKAHAASVSTSLVSPSQPFNENTEITINVTLNIESANGTEYYLGGALRKGSGNYCGFTLVNGSWVSYGSDGNKFHKVSIQDNKWEGELKVKIDSTHGSCKESGEYKLKVKRYTENSETFDEQTELTLNFNLPTPTPTNTPIPSNTPTPTKTPAPTKEPTSTPTPTPKVSKTPTVTPRTTIIPTGEEELEEAQLMMNTQADNTGGGEVQGASVDLGGNLDELDKKDDKYNWAKLLILMGAVIITGACGIFIYNNYQKEKFEELTNQQ